MTLFKLKYFDGEAYLSQSAQMYLEALIFSLERVYSLTPSFRAEKSRTTRHLTEYWHLELEEAWTDNAGNWRIQEGLVSAMVQKAVKDRREELVLLGRDPETLKEVVPPFKRVKYSDVIESLRAKQFDVSFGCDLGAVEERAVTSEEKFPVFVTNFPKECKAFYMKEDPDDPRTYKCADLLAPEGYGEVIGGSERETDLVKLVERLEAQCVPLSAYEWYLDLRRYGSVPHSGFGLGIERIRALGLQARAHPRRGAFPQNSGKGVSLGEPPCGLGVYLGRPLQLEAFHVLVVDVGHVQSAWPTDYDVGILGRVHRRLGRVRHDDQVGVRQLLHRAGSFRSPGPPRTLRARTASGCRSPLPSAGP